MSLSHNSPAAARHTVAIGCRPAGPEQLARLSGHPLAVSLWVSVPPPPPSLEEDSRAPLFPLSPPSSASAAEDALGPNRSPPTPGPARKQIGRPPSGWLGPRKRASSIFGWRVPFYPPPARMPAPKGKDVAHLKRAGRLLARQDAPQAGQPAFLIRTHLANASSSAVGVWLSRS